MIKEGKEKRKRERVEDKIFDIKVLLILLMLFLLISVFLISLIRVVRADVSTGVLTDEEGNDVDEGYIIKENYSPGEKLEGTINISLHDEAFDSVFRAVFDDDDNTEREISILEFLENNELVETKIPELARRPLPGLASRRVLRGQTEAVPDRHLYHGR